MSRLSTVVWLYHFLNVQPVIPEAPELETELKHSPEPKTLPIPNMTVLKLYGTNLSRRKVVDESLACTSLTLSVAFDKIDHAILTKRLFCVFGIYGTALSYSESYLSYGSFL